MVTENSIHCTTLTWHTYRKGHLCNATEEHLEQGEEEEAGIQLALAHAVGVQMGTQEEGGSNEGYNAGLDSLEDVDKEGALDECSFTPQGCLEGLYV